MRLALTVYSDFICPFCFLHAEVLRPLEAEEDLDVRWVGVEIHPETPPEGRTLTYEGPYAVKWDAYIAPFAEEHGIPLAFPQFLPNTADAMRAAAYADAHGKGRAFHLRTLSAYWREHQNIGDAQVLQTLARDVGLSDAEPAAWRTPEIEAAVRANRDAALDDYATGFPTTMLGRFPLMGLQHPRDLRMHLERYRGLLEREAAGDGDPAP